MLLICQKWYEKVQCFAYMFTLNLTCVHLAECYKKKDNTSDMNIIEINWDDNFWYNEIINPLSKSVDNFYDILKSDEKKIQLLNN